MRILAIISLIIFSAATCKEPAEKSMQHRKASQFILQHTQKDTIRWQLAQSYDPYEKGTVYPADPLNPKYLIVLRNGQFLEYDTLNQSRGKWYLNKTQDKIRLAYDMQNNTFIPEEDQDPYYRYKLIKLTADSLILGIQGRHGMVKRSYIQVQK